GQAAIFVNGQLTVNGGAGIDVLTINDQAAFLVPTATYTVTSAEVVREGYLGGLFPARLAVGYAGIEDLTVNTGGPISLVNVTSLPAAPVTLNPCAARHAVALGQAAIFVNGQLTVNGGAGVDILTINDQALLPATPAAYTVTATEVARERF